MEDLNFDSPPELMNVRATLATLTDQIRCKLHSCTRSFVDSTTVFAILKMETFCFEFGMNFKLFLVLATSTTNSFHLGLAICVC